MSGLVSTSVMDGMHFAWGLAEYFVGDGDQSLIMRYRYDLWAGHINLIGPECELDVARLPPPATVHSLSELEEQLQALFALHPVTSTMPQTLDLIRAGIKVGPPLSVARLAARALSLDGVVEALVAALSAAGDDPHALAEVRHIAQAATPLTEAGVHCLIVRSDSFSFNPPHLGWLLEGEAESQEILGAWIQASKEEPAARTHDEWREELVHSEQRLPRARILDRQVRLVLSRLQSLITASLSKPVAALPAPRGSWQEDVENLARSLPASTSPQLDSDTVAQDFALTAASVRASVVFSSLERAMDTPLVSLGPLLPSVLLILRGNPDYDFATLRGWNIGCLLQLLARGTSLHDARQEEIAEYLRQQRDPLDSSDESIAPAQQQAPSRSTKSGSEQDARWTLMTIVVFVLIAIVGLLIALSHAN